MVAFTPKPKNPKGLESPPLLRRLGRIKHYHLKTTAIRCALRDLSIEKAKQEQKPRDPFAKDAALFGGSIKFGIRIAAMDPDTTATGADAGMELESNADGSPKTHAARIISASEDFDMEMNNEKEVEMSPKAPLINIIPPTPTDAVRFAPMLRQCDHNLLHVHFCACATNRPKNVIKCKRYDRSMERKIQKVVKWKAENERKKVEAELAARNLGR